MLKKFVLPSILITLCALFIYCDGDNGPGPSNKPVLSNIQLQAIIHYADSQTVSVQVSDPQGLADIDSVWGNYMVPGNTQTNRYIQFHDDGTNGDANSSDGRYTARFRPASGFILAEYIINIDALDLGGHLADRVDSSFSVIDTSTALNPLLSDVELNFYHFYRDTQIVSVLVTDPEGPQDIDSVWGQYYFDEINPTFTGILFNDDGLNGDQVADDDRYTASFLPDSGAFSVGNYKVIIRAVDLGGLQAAPYDTMFVSSDSAGLVSPYLFDLELDIVHNYTDTQIVSIIVDDPQGYSDIDIVSGTYFYEFSTPQNFVLYDDGTHGDSSAGDSRFTGSFMADTGVFDIGLHYLSLLATDIDGHQSDQLDTNFTTVGNPTLSNVVAPDSLSRGYQDTAFITIDAYDPDGLADIDSVFFRVTRPNGTQNPNRFDMYDDGEQGGDVVAGDGTYSIIVQADSTSLIGDFIFRFSAFDSTGNESNNPEIIITVY